ncbi:pentapeptide repeat-containing protein [Sulfurimonas sp.]|uniref:pentapeptide repeat-containing protein n=1 Tax=Sulfurimonas sp. TaxID=2022749 RepID=UPI0025CF874B|nr:pentapeptide repeat-containing protein [Sulfurimonas sp.]
MDIGHEKEVGTMAEECTFGVGNKECSCILHCKKDSWNSLEKDELDKKIKLFFQSIENKIETVNSYHNEHKGSNGAKGIADLLQEDGKDFSQYYFDSVIFPDTNEKDPFYKLNKEIDIYFNNCRFIGKVNFNSIWKAKSITFNNCIFCNEIEFKNLKFDNNFLFENCRVYAKVNFKNVIFKNYVSFIRTRFYDELIFSQSKFEGVTLFNNSKVNKLTFYNTFFKDETNFLNIEIKDLTRETARIIKHSFEKLDNIIEANKFYALEMQKREEELSKTKEKNWLDLIVFKFHKLSSNHSQDWLLTLLWMLNTTILYTHYSFFMVDEKIEYFVIPFVLNILTTSMIGFDFSKVCKFLWTLASYLIYIFISNDYFLCCVANSFNPFSIMTGKESLTFSTLIYKSIIAYLIYQFIISIRQNTRRK